MDLMTDFDLIMKLCSNRKLPPISYETSVKILQKIRPCVNDYYNITAYHYIYAGDVGLIHYHLLLSSLIENVNSIEIDEINTVYAVVLFKGHGKDPTSDRSYRTISTCPLLAKSLDIYVRELNLDVWNEDQAETQFLGSGSSHELAAILLTETIQHSLYVSKKPLFALYLDAKSVFDNVLRQLLVRNLYMCGTSSSSINYINSRLKSRKTMVDWNKQVMGPIFDEKGIEQGGPNSGDYYKIFGKEQLTLSQQSTLGVPMPGNIFVSAIGQADDTILTSNSLPSLQNLVQITEHFCEKFHVELCIEKTKLQVFNTKDHQAQVEHVQNTSNLTLYGKQLEFVKTNQQGAEHVGIIRSASGNLPHLLKRFMCHKKALAAVTYTGIGRGHRDNPIASIQIEKIYGSGALLSGVGSLLLKKS